MLSPRSFFAFGVAFLSFTAVTPAQTVTFRSGITPLGQNDPSIHFLSKGDEGEFPSAFTPAEFAAARSGPAVFSVFPNQFWLPALASDPLAHWVAPIMFAPSDGPTALYAVDFALPSLPNPGVMNLHYAVDNTLGDASLPGLYLNGNPVPGTWPAGAFNAETTFTSGDISSLLNVGLNTLYLYVDNIFNIGQNPTGIMFSAQIGPPVPEPAGCAIVAISVTLLRRRAKVH